MFFFILAGIFAYAAAAGMAYRRAEVVHRRNCSHCEDRIGGRTGNYHDPEVGWFFTAVLWPVMLPFALGLSVSTPKENRDEKRREKEIAEAQHQAELARYKAEEHAALDRELALLERKKKIGV